MAGRGFPRPRNSPALLREEIKLFHAPLKFAPPRTRLIHRLARERPPHHMLNISATRTTTFALCIRVLASYANAGGRVGE